MNFEETVKSWLIGKYVEDIWVASSVCNLTFSLDNQTEGTPDSYELRIYGPVSISSGSSGSINISCPAVELGIVKRAEYVAACTLALGAFVEEVNLSSDGILNLAFDNGILLTVANVSESIEESWVICEPDYSQNCPQIEIHCSNRGVLDELQVGKN